MADNEIGKEDSRQAERTFLHDLASPLSTAIFVAESLIEGAQGRTPLEPEEVEQTEQLLKSLLKVADLLDARRQILVAAGS